jgi:hypothetical protein
MWANEDYRRLFCGGEGHDHSQGPDQVLYAQVFDHISRKPVPEGLAPLGSKLPQELVI